MKPIPFLTALLACTLSLSSTAAAQSGVEELLLEVREKRDKTSGRVFARIAQFGTLESLLALRAAVDMLHDEGTLSRACMAFAHYDDAQLERDAIAFLQEECTKNRREENQRAAARGLSQFGDRALPELELLLTTHGDELVRRIAAQPLIPVLGERGTVDAARTILDNAVMGWRGIPETTLREALAKCTGPGVEQLFGKRLGDRDTEDSWKQILLDQLAARPGPEATAALVDALDDREPWVRARALEHLGNRGDASQLRALRPHLKSKDDAELREAIVAVGKLAGDEQEWVEELFDLARSRKPAARMGAAIALTELRTPRAVDDVLRLLGDDDWRVRSEALRQTFRLRKSKSVPQLIERLGIESGRLERDIALVLRLLTGLDHGVTHERWAAWWKAEGGSDYTLPSYEDAVAAELERRVRRAENSTTATFYGLEVVSDRVVFALDISTSMLEPAGGGERRSRASRENRGPTRLDVARQELQKTLEGLADDVLFNVVYFGGEIEPWKKKLVAKNEKVVAQAVQYANDLRAIPGTNLYDALITAFRDERVDTIYILSDGEPTVGTVIEPNLIRERIARINRTRKVQIHSVSVGTASALLRALAEDTGGRYKETR